MRMRLIVILFFLACVEIEAMQKVPSFTATNLCMKTSSFPSKKLELLIFGFQVESYDTVIEWVRTVRRQNATLAIHTVPLVGDSLTVKLLRPFIFTALRNKAPEKYHENVFLCFDNLGTFEGLFGPNSAESKEAFVLLVSPQGDILWQGKGRPSQSSCKKLHDTVKANA